jgi:flagellar protein FliO/FliZ
MKWILALSFMFCAAGSQAVVRKPAKTKAEVIKPAPVEKVDISSPIVANGETKDDVSAMANDAKLDQMEAQLRAEMTKSLTANSEAPTADSSVGANTAAPNTNGVKANGAEVAANPQLASESKNTATVTTKAPEEEASEAETPYQAAVVKKEEASSPLLRLFLSIGILGVVAIAGYLGLRKYSAKNSNPGGSHKIKFLSQHYVGPKKSLAVIRVAGETVLIGITDHHISMIKSLALLDEDIPDTIETSSFAKVIGRSQARFNVAPEREEKASAAGREVAVEEDDEFSLAGIKDIVSKKLKGMRAID